MHTWIDIATLTKKRNAQGRFVARCQANLLLCLEPGMRVAFVPPVTDAPRNARIVEVTQTGETTADVTFEFLDGPWESTQIEALIGVHCLVPRDQIGEAALLCEDHPLIGFEVLDKRNGRIGVVREVMQNPGQSLLVLTRESDGSDLLVPNVSAIVLEIDEEHCTIKVDLPIGLLDL